MKNNRAKFNRPYRQNKRAKKQSFRVTFIDTEPFRDNITDGVNSGLFCFMRITIVYYMSEV